jgi:hypothetical protein
MMGPGFADGIGNAMTALALALILMGVAAGACGTCAVQKASEYRIKVEKTEPPRPSSSPGSGR